MVRGLLEANLSISLFRFSTAQPPNELPLEDTINEEIIGSAECFSFIVWVNGLDYFSTALIGPFIVRTFGITGITLTG